MEDKIPKSIDWEKIREISERAKKQKPMDFGGQFGVDPHSYAVAQTKPEKKEEFQNWLLSDSAKEKRENLLLWLGKVNFHILIENLSPFVLLSLLEKISIPTLKNVFDSMSSGEKQALKTKISTLTKEIEKIDGKSRFTELEEKIKNPFGASSDPEEEHSVNEISEEDLRSMGLK
ncbi:MAG: hypothetical protein WC870_00575 [Candidatus Paceibacterota bacterium]